MVFSLVDVLNVGLIEFRRTCIDLFNDGWCEASYIGVGQRGLLAHGSLGFTLL